MRIISLAENTSCRKDLGAEHGLSLYIETLNHKLLFDMGQTGLFAENARKLDVDLAAVNIAILSHGHYDHGGGLETFLKINKKAPVYLSRHAFEAHYNGTEKYIGLDVKLQAHPRLIFTEDITPICKGLTLYSCNEKNRNYDLGSFGLNRKEDGQFLPDDFRHEQYLLIEEEGKRVLISGCSHKGILNIVQWFQPQVLVGGFHFSKLPLYDTLKTYAQYLEESGTIFYPCHCTGTRQFDFMKQSMSRLSYFSCGETLIL